jgi:hypothetical protein
MKNLLICGLITCSNVGSIHAQYEDPMPAPVFKVAFHKNVTLLAGTIILLETSEQISSSQISVGTNLKCNVSANVVVQGHIAIRTGALALGRIKSISPSTHNSAEMIIIEMVHVQAVDGKMVSLIGSEQAIKGQFPGQDVSIESGVNMTSFVNNNTEVNID